MDYLLVLIASVLFPYAYNQADLYYTVDFGIKTAWQQTNKYNVKLIFNNVDAPYEIIDTSPVTVNYGLRPEFFIDYPLNLKRWWVTPTLGWEPLQTIIKYKYKASDAEDDTATDSSISYDKTPYFGLKLGYAFRASNQFGSYSDAIGITPYVVATIGRVYYTGESGDLISTGAYNYRYTLGAGAKISLRGNWALYAQYQTVNFKENKIDDTHLVKINESQIQFGLAYVFRSSASNDKINKVSNYDNIMQQLQAQQYDPVKATNNSKNTSFKPSAVTQTNDQLKKEAAQKANNNLPDKLPAPIDDDFDF